MIQESAKIINSFPVSCLLSGQFLWELEQGVADTCASEFPPEQIVEALLRTHMRCILAMLTNRCNILLQCLHQTTG
jgi:hypothetical protein